MIVEKEYYESYFGLNEDQARIYDILVSKKILEFPKELRIFISKDMKEKSYFVTNYQYVNVNGQTGLIEIPEFRVGSMPVDYFNTMIAEWIKNGYNEEIGKRDGLLDGKSRESGIHAVET